MSFLLLTALGLPTLLFLVLSLFSLVGKPLPERVTGRLVPVALLPAFVSSLGIAFLYSSRVELAFSPFGVIAGQIFEFRLILDWLSIPFLVLILLLCGVTGFFAHSYLHKEPGYNRFFVLFSLFVVGMEFAALAGSMETLVAAWELLGLSSALLIAFFHDRPEPVRNALRVWTIYRVGDLGLIFAACLAHHWTGTGAFGVVFASGHWSLALLILLAAMGKSALLPFSNWLPRAMEGPTPSSAIFYGALSVHLGAFLLLRAAPLLDANQDVAWLLVALGLATSLHGTFVGRAQTDIKCALAFASLTQVGLIVAEIGLGLRWIPLIHLLGHASLRTLQLLRAPSLLHDLHRIENAVGTHLPRTGIHYEKFLPAGLRFRLYRAALERGYLEAILRDWVARPFLAVAAFLDRMELWWVAAFERRGK
ncbi:MAG TPA: proton-conducting transporter membrane subunit [bacterium]|nr:proton-conducting transporter membrane subunit [bacterium]